MKKLTLKESKKMFKPFIRFKQIKEDPSNKGISYIGNNILSLKKNANLNENDSGIENLGTDWMLKQMGEGNFKFARRWSWLYRHYIWASKVIVPRAHVLDIGCDVGEIRKIISKSFYTKNPLYVGIDLDHKRLKAGAEAIQMNIPAMYIQHDITTGLGFVKSNSVDMIFAGEIIEHFKKKFGKVMLKEMKRVLKPGGKFIVSTPNKKNTKGYEFHVHEYEVSELIDLVKKVGFKIDKVWGWTTTERRIKQQANLQIQEMYDILKNNVHKDLVVSMIAYLDPEISEAFCVEGRKS